MSEQWTWEPLPDNAAPIEIEIEYYVEEAGDDAVVYSAAYPTDTGLTMHDQVRTTISWSQHDDLRLCRRVPASAGVPVGAIRKLIAFVDEWGSIGDTEGMPNLWIEVAEARTWLDRITTAEQYAQPQTGQEGDR